MVKDMSETNIANNFIHAFIDEDLAEGAYDKVATRFPPEPNGYLHVGHAKSICLNFGTATKYRGTCNLRYDDTNPVKEDMEYVNAIEKDIKWLGFEWADKLWASDYFDTMYDAAVELINKGLAYVDDLSAEEIKEHRGTLTEAGKESPYRNRSVEENLDLFRRDQIWFTEMRQEDRSTDLYSLAEVKQVRKEENFEKGYIAGRYGAIPMLNLDFAHVIAQMQKG